LLEYLLFSQKDGRRDIACGKIYLKAKGIQNNELEVAEMKAEEDMMNAEKE